jgi:hypothetical protein
MDIFLERLCLLHVKRATTASRYQFFPRTTASVAPLATIWSGA